MSNSVQTANAVLTIISYHAMPFHSPIPYHTVPYHTIPYHTIPYHTIPYHTIPFPHTIPWHSPIPYHGCATVDATIPCHTIPWLCYRRQLPCQQWDPAVEQFRAAIARGGSTSPRYHTALGQLILSVNYSINYLATYRPVPLFFYGVAEIWIRDVFSPSDPSTFDAGGSQTKHVSNPYSVITKFNPLKFHPFDVQASP